MSLLDPAEDVLEGGIAVPVGGNDCLDTMRLALQVAHGSVDQQVQSVTQAGGGCVDRPKDVVGGAVQRAQDALVGMGGVWGHGSLTDTSVSVPTGAPSASWTAVPSSEARTSSSSGVPRSNAFSSAVTVIRSMWAPWSAGSV